MPRPRGVRGRRLELAVLALGLASSALLAAAGLAPFSDPELAGRAAFAELAGRVEDGVAAEWNRMLAERDVLASEAVAWDSSEAARSAALGAEAQPLEPAPERSSFEVLLAEALRLEASGELAEALRAALESAEKSAPVARKALARLVAIRSARAVDDCVTAAAQWDAASAELEGAESSDGMPLLALCALAASPCLQGDARSAAQARAVGAWAAGKLALGPSEQRKVLAERLTALDPEGTSSAELAAYEKARSLSALADASPSDSLPPRPEDASWHLRDHGESDRMLAWRAEGADAVIAGPIARTDLIERLRERVERNALVPGGFRLQFGLAGERLEGEAVRERRELAGGALGFTLRHVDPEAAARAEGGRLRMLRLALLAVAALTAGASWATFRALRRGRRLAEMKSAFVASVSHELRTPLASILMLAENLESGRVADAEGRARYHGLILREAERLRRLVADVLDFSRLERGKPLEMRRDEVELAEFCAGLADEARAWAARNEVDLSVDLGAARGRTQLDAEALRRAVENLLDNARKHSGERSMSLSASVEGGVFELAVEDAGRGVSSALAKSVFEPFARGESHNGAAGTGLGLAIVREIAREHGGDVALELPRGGRGARFAIRIPLARTASAAEVGA
jgi:signal transduction histidine kinase